MQRTATTTFTGKLGQNCQSKTLGAFGGFHYLFLVNCRQQKGVFFHRLKQILKKDKSVCLINTQ